MPLSINYTGQSKILSYNKLNRYISLSRLDGISTENFIYYNKSKVGFSLKNELVLVKKDDIKAIKEEEGKMVLYPIFQFSSKSGVDVFLVELDPGCKHISAAHKNVLEEMVLVIEGTLTLKVEKEIYEIKAGNSLKFDGSLNHTYMNKGNEKVAFHNIEIYK